MGVDASCLSNTGYRLVRVAGKLYQAHWLVWFYFFQEWPENKLDHINGNRQDNRLDNLRECTDLENTYNSGVRSNSLTGVKGVQYDKERKKFKARIKIDGKSVHLGRFDTVEEASEAYNKKAKELHGEFYKDTTK